jgi:hypothetical protein
MNEKASYIKSFFPTPPTFGLDFQKDTTIDEDLQNLEVHFNFKKINNGISSEEAKQ